MAADGSATATHRDARLDVVALPKPTTGRVLVLLTALLTVGVTVGNLAHTTVIGERWLGTVSRCSEEASQDPRGADPLTANDIWQSCMAPAERVRTAFMAGGVLTVVGGSAVLLYGAPVLVRRRRNLRPAGPKLAPVVARVSELAGAGRRVPDIVLGASHQRDAFCFGSPGRPVLVLPPALAVRYNDASLFDPVVRHELAHVRHRDVPIAWLARGFLVVAGLIAFVPLLTAAATGDRSVLADYVWRVVILVGVGWLVARSVLRIREHDADLSADAADSGSLARVLESGLMLAATTGWRRWIAHHPSAKERVQVILEPERIAVVAFAGGLLPGFFAAVAVPSLVSMTSVMLTGSGRSLQSYAVAAAVGGLVLAGSVGVDIYRAATVEVWADSGPLLHDASVAAGAGIGVLAGQLITPAAAWTDLTFGLPVWAVPIPGVLVAGAVAALCGAARSLAGRHVPPLALVLSAAGLLGVTLWSGLMLQLSAQAGLDFLRLALLFGQALWPSTVAVLAATAAGVIIRGRGAVRDLGVGVVAGAAGGAVLVVVRLLTAPAETEAEKVAVFLLAIETAVFAALAAALVLALLEGTRGALSGLIALPAGVATAVAVFGIQNVARGGTTDVALIDSVVRPALVIGFLVVMLVALVGLAPRPRARKRSRSILAATGLVTVAAVATSAIAGPLLLPDAATFLTPLPLPGPPTAVGDPESLGGDGAGLGSDAALYAGSLAPHFNDQLLLLVSLADAAAELPANPALADELDEGVVGLLDEFARQANSFQPPETDVAQAHQSLLETIELTQDYVADLIEFHRRDDPANLEEAIEHRRDADLAYLRWVYGVTRLG